LAKPREGQSAEADYTRHQMYRAEEKRLVTKSEKKEKERKKKKTNGGSTG